MSYTTYVCCSIRYLRTSWKGPLTSETTLVSVSVASYLWKLKQSHCRPRGPDVSRRLRFPDFNTIGKWRWEVYQPYVPATFTPRKHSWYSLLLETESTPGHSAAGRIMSMKYSNDTIGNRTCDLPACSAVPQPTAPPAACHFILYVVHIM